MNKPQNGQLGSKAVQHSDDPFKALRIGKNQSMPCLLYADKQSPRLLHFAPDANPMLPMHDATPQMILGYVSRFVLCVRGRWLLLGPFRFSLAPHISDF